MWDSSGADEFLSVDNDVSHAKPGQTYLVHQGSGGYSDRLGWTGGSGDLPTVATMVETESPDANDANKLTFIGRWVELASHLEHAGGQARLLAAEAGLSVDLGAALVNAALWHDVGKAHPCFQQMLLRSGTPPILETVWAKSALQQGHCDRKGFRHELASALAWLQLAQADITSNIVAYLIAAHHGRVRLSIRSLPSEANPPEAGRLFARGIWQGDRLPAVWPGGRRRFGAGARSVLHADGQRSTRRVLAGADAAFARCPGYWSLPPRILGNPVARG